MNQYHYQYQNQFFYGMRPFPFDELNLNEIKKIKRKNMFVNLPFSIVTVLLYVIAIIFVCIGTSSQFIFVTLFSIFFSLWFVFGTVGAILLLSLNWKPHPLCYDINSAKTLWGVLGILFLFGIGNFIFFFVLNSKLNNLIKAKENFDAQKNQYMNNNYQNPGPNQNQNGQFNQNNFNNQNGQFNQNNFNHQNQNGQTKQDQNNN